MKFARYMSLVALAMAVAFMMAVVPSAPKSASAQGPAYRYECNYVTMSSKVTETSPVNTQNATPNSTGSQSGVTVTGGTGTTVNAAVPPAIATNRCSAISSAVLANGTADKTALCYLNTSLATTITEYETYVNKDVLISIAGTGSFSGIANRRQLKARVTSFVIEGDAAATGASIAVKTRHVVEFDNYSDADGVCRFNEMCFVALGEGTVTDYPAGHVMAYDQKVDNNDNLNLSIAVISGEQQLKGLCGRLTNSRNNSTNVVTLADLTPGTAGSSVTGEVAEANPNNGQLQSRSELSKLNSNSLVFNFAGALCECQTNKSGPTDYGTQNNQGQ